MAGQAPATYQRPDFQGTAPQVGQAPATYQRPDIQAVTPAVGQAPATYQRPDFQPTTAPEFQGTLPAPELMSLEEMMSMVNNRANLAYDAPMAAKERGLEEEMLRGEQTKGEVKDAYAKAMEDLRKAGQGYQQGMADQMRVRGIYDSGLSIENSNRIYLTMLKSNLEISSAEAKELSNLAEYLDLRQRHTGEEIQQMMGEKAMFAQSLLDEMHLRNQDRGDMLAQREFENWLATQHFQLQNEQTQRQEYWNQVGFDAQQMESAYTRHWNDKMFEWQQYESQLQQYWNQAGFDAQQSAQEYQRYMDRYQMEWQQYESQLNQYWNATGYDFQTAQAEYQKYWDQVQFGWQQHVTQLDEYWRQTGFDAQQSEQEYQRYWDQVNHNWNQYLSQMDQYRWGADFDARQHDAAWSRIDSMQRWEAIQELEMLKYNNLLSQQDFDNMIALSDQEMKAALYRAQYGG